MANIDLSGIDFSNLDVTNQIELELAKARKSTIQAAVDLLSGPEVKAILDQLNALVARLPLGSPIRNDLFNVVNILDVTPQNVNYRLTEIQNTIEQLTPPPPPPVDPAPVEGQ